VLSRFGSAVGIGAAAVADPAGAGDPVSAATAAAGATLAASEGTLDAIAAALGEGLAVESDCVWPLHAPRLSESTVTQRTPRKRIKVSALTAAMLLLS
jgi:hypothetical protein